MRPSHSPPHSPHPFRGTTSLCLGSNRASSFAIKTYNVVSGSATVQQHHDLHFLKLEMSHDIRFIKIHGCEWLRGEKVRLKGGFQNFYCIWRIMASTTIVMLGMIMITLSRSRSLFLSLPLSLCLCVSIYPSLYICIDKNNTRQLISNTNKNEDGNKGDNKKNNNNKKKEI